jgi:hypothetical protein
MSKRQRVEWLRRVLVPNKNAKVKIAAVLARLN